MMELRMENYQEIEVKSISTTGKVLDTMVVMVCDGALYVQGKWQVGAKRVNHGIFREPVNKRRT